MIEGVAAVGQKSYFRRAVIAALVIMVIVAAAIFLRGSGLSSSAEALSSAGSYGASVDWSHHGGSVDESGYSQLSDIKSANIERLGLAWSLDLPGEAVLEATPLAVNGVLYFTGARSAVYAVDALSGKLLWKHDPEIWKHHPERMSHGLTANRGAAYADGRVFVATFDGRLIALDAKAGKVLWTVETIAPGTKYYSSGAPLVFKDKVIIGNGGADLGARGYVTAYDQKTGAKAWRFYTVPGSPEENRGDPAMEAAARTWSGEYWKTGTGGTVWNGMTFDPELNRLYIGTGNSGPYDPDVRSPGDGDNLYLASIVALDADTGKYIWHYQQNPREAWDYKSVADIITATIPIDGKPRKVLLHAPTNGFFYVLDRETGKLISAEKLGEVDWAERIDLATGRPVERPNIRYEKGEFLMRPGPIGMHNWQPMSYSPKTGLVYIPAQQLPVTYKRGKPDPSAMSLGGIVMKPVKVTANDFTAWLQAWDPARQKPAWKVPLSSFWNGGTLATAGNLVFQGTGNGYFTAYDAQDGKQLWQFNVGHGVIGAPISYSAGGRQYISLLAGYGGAASMGRYLEGWKYGAQPRRLLTFMLDGKAQLPPTAPRDMKVHPVDDPSIRISDADVSAGRMEFVACAMCHGRDAISGGTAPDLRESAAAMDFAALRSVVRDGILLQNGMPRYEDMTDDQLRKIHAYIRARARETLGTRKPGAEVEDTITHF